MSTVEYSYCAVCRRNHDDGRKHIFTSKHQSKLSELLKKFGSKVLAARKLLEKPVVIEGELEPGATVWCYCCDTEVNKHVCDGLLSVEWGGLLEHLTSRGHHKKARHYWWRHGADTGELQSFVVFDAEYLNFKTKVADEVALIEQRREQRLQEAAQALRVKEETQKEVSREPPPPAAALSAHIVYVTVSNKLGVLQNPTGWHEGRRVWGGGIVKLKLDSDQLLVWEIDHIEGRTDTSVRGPSEGNVHTGATPPWLKEDEEEKEASVIGPSLDAFLLHRDQQRRASKNPNRVGADFHRTKPKEDSDDWLPSFGRVWNAGSRTESRSEFCQEIKKAVQLPSHRLPQRSTPTHQEIISSEGCSSSSGTTPSTLEKNSQLKPYVRKRPVNTTRGGVS